MENLNAEQVKRGLERCANEWHCGLCGFTEKECALIKKSALTLINSQEQRIKELTEDVERVTKQCGEIIVECDERDTERLKQVAELTEENERLTLKVAAYQVKDKLLSNQLDDKCDMCIARERADTVRKMQERFKSCFEDDVKYDGFRIAIWIDQIAKEMLEGEK